VNEGRDADQPGRCNRTALQVRRPAATHGRWSDHLRRRAIGKNGIYTRPVSRGQGNAVTHGARHFRVPRSPLRRRLSPSRRSCAARHQERRPETYSRATGKELEPTLRNGGKTTTAIGPDRDEWPAWVGKSHWLKSGRTSAVGGFERARFRVTMLWKRTFVLRRKLAERRPAAFGRRAQQAAIRSGWRRSAVHDPKWTLALEIARCWKL
jgi:hypothetical protein